MAYFKQNEVPQPTIRRPAVGADYDDLPPETLTDDAATRTGPVIPAQPADAPQVYDDLYVEAPAWGQDDEPAEEEDAETRRERSSLRARTAAGVFDFFGVIAGAVVILLLVAVLISLVNWVVSDIGDPVQVLVNLI